MEQDTAYSGLQSLDLRHSETECGVNPAIVACIRHTLEMALRMGANSADIVLAESENQSLQAQDGKIAENTISASRVLGIRVERGERIGLSYSESLLESDRRTMVEMALWNSQLTKEDPSCVIHNSATAPLLPDCSAQYSNEQICLSEKEELALRLEREPHERDSRVSVVPYSGFNEGRGSRYVANSNGVFCYERSYGYNCYTYVLMEEGGTKADFGQWRMARHFAGLDWQSCVSKALEEAALLLEAKPIASGHYDVIFTPDALASLLSSFELMFSGFAAKTKTNPLRDKLGEQIASEQLRLLDMPRYAPSLHMQYFDAEGLVPQDLLLIEDGVLKNFYHNCETATHFRTQSNARATRSPQGSLGTAGNCLVIVPGNDSATAVRDGQFFEVQELNGLHSGCDATSGDFSLPCNGKLYRNGELLQGVRDVTLAGNFYEMLKQLSMLGNELKSSSGKGLFAPDLRFSGLTVAG